MSVWEKIFKVSN